MKMDRRAIWGVGGGMGRKFGFYYLGTIVRPPECGLMEPVKGFVFGGGGGRGGGGGVPT